MLDHSLLYQQCEAAIRISDVRRVKHLLNQLEIADVPVDMRFGFANLARRSGWLALGLKLLGPIVRQDRKYPLGRAPNPAEITEYAVLLLRAGVIREAKDRLQALESKNHLDASLYLAFCGFNEWDYASSIPRLKNYIERQNEPYMNLVGQVNLSAALVVLERFDEALETLQGIRDSATKLQATSLL
jgi:tetratricopeptide (TPR) repeat protein